MKSTDSAPPAPLAPPAEAVLEQLIERIGRGDRDALGALYDRHGALLFATARSLLGEDAIAEDCVVAVFSELVGRAARFDANRCRPSLWLAMAVRRRALELRRIGGRRRPSVRGGSAGAREGPPHDPLARALDALPGNQSRAVRLAVGEGLTTPAIAERLGTSVRVVEAWLDRGLADVRAELIREGGQR